MEDIEDLHLVAETGAIGSAFILLVNVLRIYSEEFGQIHHYPNDIGGHMSETQESPYDYIIVGAGTAGCVLANRLTGIPEYRTLLVEAGEYPSATTEVPGFFQSLPSTSEDWQFLTNECSNACRGMLNNVCTISKGKVVGGTSTIGNLHYTRAHPQDFENWYNLGNTKWSSDYFGHFSKNVENYVGPKNYPMDYGIQGELTLDVFNSSSYVKDLLYKSVSRFGYHKIDKNQHIGYLETVATVKNGVRENAAKAFLAPVKRRSNLFFLKGCTATKILISGKTKRASGIECMLEGRVKQLMAKREVILSAGAINTPKLLMLSGVGPKDVLQSLDIPLLADLQVGRNLQVHFGVPIFVGVKDEEVKTDQVYKVIDATYLYIMNTQGPLATTRLNDLVGFLNTKGMHHDIPNVAVYHYLFETNDVNLESFLDSIGYIPEIKKSVLEHNRIQQIIMFVPTVIRPKSTGNVILQNSKPTEPPLIMANFLTDENNEDLQILISSYSYIMELATTPEFQALSGKLLQIDLPNCRNYPFCTASYINCYIQNMGYPQSDVAGTTKMGPWNDASSVVDQDLFVRGITGLRVVDASVMPVIVSANTQATVVTMADIVSRRILDSIPLKNEL